jgi:hypothetical protein
VHLQAADYKDLDNLFFHSTTQQATTNLDGLPFFCCFICYSTTFGFSIVLFSMIILFFIIYKHHGAMACTINGEIIIDFV